MSSPAVGSNPAGLRFLITGGAKGLGRGLSRLLLQAGHDVFIFDSNAGELRHTLDKHLPSVIEAQKKSSGESQPGRVGGSLCDVSSLESVRKAMAEAKKFHRGSQLDVVVNNAGKANPYWADGKDVSQLGKGTGAADDDGGLAEWNEWIGVNLTGAFIVSKEAVPLLAKGEGREKGGSIIQVSSARARQSEPNQEGYAASKAGMLGLNHALASSLSPYGIRSNAILPGWFPSAHESEQGDQGSVAWDAELTEADREQFWTKRAGKVEDLAQAVLFCAGNGFLTGQEIVLDGGMEKKMIYVE